MVEWSEEPDVNSAEASGWCKLTETQVSDVDTASVRVFICGDADGSGGVTMADGRQIFMNILFGAEKYPIDPCAADCDGSPGITMSDGRQIFMNILFGSGSYPLVCGCGPKPV